MDQTEYEPDAADLALDRELSKREQEEQFTIWLRNLGLMEEV